MGAGSSVGGGGCEVEVFGGFGQVERGQDGLLVDGEGRALCVAAVGGGQGDQVHAVEFVAQVAPSVTGACLGDTDDKQYQTKKLDISAYAVLIIVVVRA